MINLGGRVKPYCGLSINRREDLREEIIKEKKEYMHVNLSGTPILYEILSKKL